ncbi:MAG: DUF1428 domain-containing protein [Spirochaetes bacterium]|nr:DUF1428 domain-containing protein [Spirochaetota bacterium]
MTKSKIGYVDGFVLVIPKKKANEYRTMARKGRELWMKYGALNYKECVIDDANPPYIVFTFPKMVKVKPGETVWFSYIEFRSKKHRDRVNALVMKDPTMKSDPDHEKKMPFDMKRMAYGGFRVVVSS